MPQTPPRGSGLVLGPGDPAPFTPAAGAAPSPEEDDAAAGPHAPGPGDPAPFTPAAGGHAPRRVGPAPLAPPPPPPRRHGSSAAAENKALASEADSTSALGVGVFGPRRRTDADRIYYPRSSSRSRSRSSAAAADRLRATAQDTPRAFEEGT
ncbi:MAG: hypothetical protein GY772_22850 [bacterium]|nr:hypothetical protein [bacterium]